MSEVTEVLIGHNSIENAYIIPDYPTGRRARCVKRVWIETNKHGQRLIYQTSQPKHKMERAGWNEGDPVPEKWWRTPKKSTYSDITVMYLDENGHQQLSGISAYYANLETLEAFEQRFAPLFETDEYARKTMAGLKSVARR